MLTRLKKLIAGKAPQRPEIRFILWSWLGAAVTIALVGLIAEVSGYPFLMAPLGASAVLAFAVPDSPLAQPRNIIGGHIAATFVGLALLGLFGPHWWVAGLAVASAIAVMQFTGTLHPPAGANPLVVLTIGAGWDYILIPIALSALTLTLCAYVFNNVAPRREYPTFWY